MDSEEKLRFWIGLDSSQLPELLIKNEFELKNSEFTWGGP